MCLSGFVPHPLIRGGSLQTVVGHVSSFPETPQRYEEILVDLGDGDRLLLHVDHPERERVDSPIVLLIHGLTGCSESKYILRISRKLSHHGYTVVRFNHRGCGRGGAALARQIYHAGRIEDILATLLELKKRWRKRPVVACAFSLSGNMLLKLLGTNQNVKGRYSHLQRGLAVCPPIDLELCSQALTSRANWYVDRFYTNTLIKTAHARAQLFPDIASPRFPTKMNLRRFDELFTAPTAGFRSLEDYYTTCSSKDDLHNIAIDTTIIAAKDDPVIPAESFRDAKLNQKVRLRIERSGGHMGFLSAQKTVYGDFRWLDLAVISWARQGESQFPLQGSPQFKPGIT